MAATDPKRSFAESKEMLNYMRISVCLITLTSALLVSSCSKWPPYHDDLAERFTENRDAFEELEARILGTHYVRVSGGCVFNSDRERIPTRVKFTWKVDNSEGKDHIYDQKSIEDEEWSDLFCETLVWSVANHDGVVRFDFGSSVYRNGKSVYAEYTHSRETLESRKPCLPEHKNLPCGLCSVKLDEEWFIDYWWVPEDILEGEYDDVIDGILPEDEYWSRYDEELKQCRIAGYTAIGYDTADWRDKESSDR